MLKVFEMFAGYGGSSFALKRLEIDFKVIGYSEIKKHAIKIYEQNHPNIKNFGDCQNIDPNDLEDFDLLTAGFPCVDVSIAGKRDLSRGRTLLFEEIIRIAKIKKPSYMVLENVKGLLYKKEFFKYVIESIEKLGYNIHWRVLNSRDYNLPQSRERIFFICFRDDLINDYQSFNFPSIEVNNTKIQDLLEKNVDEKYYLTFDKKWMFENDRYKFLGSRDDYLNTLTGGHSKGWDDYRIVEGCSLRSFPRNKPNQSNRKQKCEIRKDCVINCLSTVNKDSLLLINNCKVRYLTPLERFRFMGFKDKEINFEGIKPTNIMDLVGNGWDINLVTKIFQNLLKIKTYKR